MIDTIYGVSREVLFNDFSGKKPNSTVVLLLIVKADAPNLRGLCVGHWPFYFFLNLRVK
jgi:hypothetical protein